MPTKADRVLSCALHYPRMEPSSDGSYEIQLVVRCGAQRMLFAIRTEKG